jgi:AraC family chitin signaling transcriptional activator
MLKQIFTWKKDNERKDTPPIKGEVHFTSNEIIEREQAKFEGKFQELEDEIRTIKIQLLKSGKKLEAYEELVSTIDQVLKKMEENSTGGPYVLEIKRLIRAVDQKENDAISIHLEDLHRDFMSRLKKTYSSLTLYDLKLATYIKMGLSTKEIASILNILPSSINVSRSRLRKKLQLKTKDDLFLALEKV